MPQSTLCIVIVQPTITESERGPEA